MFLLDLCSEYGMKAKKVEEYMLSSTRRQIIVDVKELKFLLNPSLPSHFKIEQL